MRVNDVIYRKMRLLTLGFISIVIILVGVIVFLFMRPAIADTAVGTCLSVSKGGTGCFDIEFLNKLYPIGAIYITTVNNNPSEYLGGTWESFGTGQTLVGVDTTQAEFDVVEKSGGEKTNTLTIEQTPAHTHTRGTMEITGTMDIRDINMGNHDSVLNGTGAFSVTYPRWSGAHNAFADISKDPYYRSRVDFTASNSWTGETSSVGEGQAHNNLQPYITVYMWKRTS